MNIPIIVFIMAFFSVEFQSVGQTEQAAPRASERISSVKHVSVRPDEKNLLRLNFRGAPLEKVLAYLCEATGYTIVLQTTVAGTIDVWNDTPMTRAEAFDVLNAALARNGLAAIVEGRRVTIVSRDAAATSRTPVRAGSRAAEIASDETVATQIIPVSHVNATQLIRDLGLLIPKTAEVTANEGGNVIVMTDTQANIRHFVQIIEAIEASVSGASNVRVFPLRSADSKSIAGIIKDLFAPDTSAGNGRAGSVPGAVTSRFAGRFPGGAGGDVPGGSPRNGSRGPSGPRVLAVADERSNSVVVSATDDLVETIQSLVTALDETVDDVTELRVFRLKNADPVEMADMIAGLYPNDTRPTDNGGSRMMTSPGAAGLVANPNPAPAPAGADASERAKKQGRVTAVPDPRTVSLVISASRDLMRQIEEVITKMDSDRGRKMVVRIYSVQSADPVTVQQILQELFPSSSGAARPRTVLMATSPLATRENVQGQGTGIPTGAGLPGAAAPGGARTQ